MYNISRKVYEYISKKNNDPILERRTCRWTGEVFPIYQKDVDMMKRLSPKIGDTVYQLPLPTLCPWAREFRRLFFKNERNLFKDICEKTQTPTISRFTNKHVYSNKARHGDDREQVSLAVDPKKTLYQHLQKLIDTTIYQDLIWSSKNVLNNAKYTNHASKQSNSYLLMNARDDEYSAYWTFVHHCKRVFDCNNISHCEHCYECISSHALFSCFYCIQCADSNNLRFCKDMKGSHDCLFCYGLQNVSYYVNNTYVGKEVYEQELKKINIWSYASLQHAIQIYEQNIMKWVRPALENISSENIIGNECSHCSNVHIWFELQACHDVRYTNSCFESQDIMDVSAFWEGSPLMYECTQSWKNSSKLHFCSMIGESQRMMFCFETKHCSDCFWCVNLYKKQFCIFNKQYTEKDYYDTVHKIMEQFTQTAHRWEFIDPSYSVFPYNDTPANDYFPPRWIIDTSWNKKEYCHRWVWTLTKLSTWDIVDAEIDVWGDVRIKTRRRETKESINIPAHMKHVHADTLPDSIDEIDVEILEKALQCRESWRVYRPIWFELDFYKKHGIAFPRLHPDLRHTKRCEKKTKRSLHLRTCDKTGEEMLSVYPQGVPFNVYSEKAYTQEIYG